MVHRSRVYYALPSADSRLTWMSSGFSGSGSVEANPVPIVPRYASRFYTHTHTQIVVAMHAQTCRYASDPHDNTRHHQHMHSMGGTANSLWLHSLSLSLALSKYGEHQKLASSRFNLVCSDLLCFATHPWLFHSSSYLPASGWSLTKDRKWVNCVLHLSWFNNICCFTHNIEQNINQSNFYGCVQRKITAHQWMCKTLAWQQC